MQRWKKAFALTLLTAFPITGYSCTNTWTGTANDGAWANGVNWGGGCVPGATARTAVDNATFTTQAGTQYTINLNTGGGIIPGLNQMLIQNPTSSYTFIGAITNPIQFNGTTPLLQQTDPAGSTDVTTFQCPIVINDTTLTVDITSSTAGITLNRGLTSFGTSSLLITGPGTWTQSYLDQPVNIDIAGSLIATNTQIAVINTHPVVLSDNVSIVVGGIQFSGSNVNFINTGATSGTPSNGSVLDASLNIDIESCTVTVTNTGAINGPGTSNNSGHFFRGPNFAVNNTTLIVQNTGDVSNGDNCGIKIRAFSNYAMTGGSLTATNTGAITDIAPGNGGIAIVSNNDFNATEADLTLTNSGSVTTAGSGVQLQVSSSTVLSDTDITTLNQGSVSGGSEGINLELATLSVTNGAWNGTNAGAVSGGGNGLLISMSGNATLNDAMISLANTGAVSGGSIGSYWNSTGNPVMMNGGTLALSNTGAVADTSIGNQFVCTDFVLNGGLVILNNTGSAPSASQGLFFTGTGAINLNAGTFINNAGVGTPSLNIATGATFAGNGSLISVAVPVAVANSGNLTPGQPGVGGNPGVLTIVEGNYTQTPAGTFLANFGSTNHSLLQVQSQGIAGQGLAQLAGTLEVALTKTGIVQPGIQYPIIVTDPGVSGTFSNVVNLNIPNVNVPLVHYTPSTVYVSFTPTANTLTNLIRPIFNTVNETNVRLGREMEEVRKRFYSNQTACVPIAATFAGPNLTVFNGRLIAQNSRVSKKQDQLRDDQKDSPGPWNFYFGPTAECGDVFTEKHISGYGYWAAGALAGFDYAFNQVGVGLLVDYNHFHADVAHHDGSFNINELHASAYSTYVPESVPELAVNGILGGGYNWYSINRNIRIGTFAAKSHPAGGEFDALLGLEYALRKNNIDSFPDQFQLVPLFSLQYIYANVGNYHEHGASGFELKFKSQGAQSLRSTLGTRLNYSWISCSSDFVVTPELLVAWQYEFLDQNRAIRFTPVDFTVPTAQLIVPRAGRNTALGGFDLLVTFYKKYGIEASYDFEWNSSYHNHFFYLGCNFRF